MPLVHINILLRVSVERYEVNAIVHMYFAMLRLFCHPDKKREEKPQPRRGLHEISLQQVCEASFLIKNCCGSVQPTVGIAITE